MFMSADGLKNGYGQTSFTIEWETAKEYLFLVRLANILNESFPYDEKGTKNIEPNYQAIAEKISNLDPLS